MPLIDIDGNINDKDLDDNFNFLLGEVNSLKSTVSDLSLNKATKSEIVREIDLVASNIVNDTVGVSGYAVSNALLGLKNRIDNIIASSGTSSTELVDSRYDSVFDVTYTVLSDRLDAMSQYAKDLFDSLNIPDVTPITVSETIKSLTAGSIEGKVSNLSWYGLTLVNSIENGDFSDGTTGWIGSNGGISVSNNILTQVASSSDNFPYVFITDVLPLTDKFFVYAKARVTNSESTSLKLDGVYDNSFQISNPELNKWYDLYFTGNVISGTSGNVARVIHFYQDATTANGKVMEVDGNAGVHAINLTALGLTALTESQMLDLVRSGYIDGIQSMYRPTLKIDGKNKFEFDSFFKGYDLSFPIVESDGIDPSVYRHTTGKYLKAGDYVISSTETNLLFRYLTEDGVVAGGYSNPATFTITKNQKVAFNMRNTSSTEWDFSEVPNDLEIQLEEGTSATAYEPYNSSEIVADVYLRGFNGVFDEIYESNDKIWLDKNVEEGIIGEDIILTSVTDYTNITIAFSQEISDIIPQTNNLDGSTMLSSGKEIVFTERDDTSQIGNWYTSAGSPNRVVFILPLGTSLATAQADLAGKVIQYHTVQQEPINLTEQGLVDGQLESRENGTVYNTSDTFGSVDVSFDVPTNRAGQIASLIEANSYQQEQIDAKANKVQEEVIVPTLINSWTGTPYYYLNEVEEVKLSGLLQSGTGIAFALPTGYRPSVEKKFKQADTTTGNPTVTIGTDGTVTPSGDCYLDGISFRVGE